MPKDAQNDIEKVCLHTRSLLSPYLEGTLSAREVWAIEMHLRSCKSCSDFRRELQLTIELLHSTPRLDTSNDFMARLHSKIDAIEPTQVRQNSWRPVFQARWEALKQIRPTLSLSAIGVTIVTLALLPLLWKQQPLSPPQREERSLRETRRALTEPLNQTVASSADDLLSDPAATNLEAQVVLNELGTKTATIEAF